MSEQRKVPFDEANSVWSCSHCGPHPKSSRNWCAAGCGRDYNRMTQLPEPQAEKRWRELEAERDRYRDALQRIADHPPTADLHGPRWKHWRTLAGEALDS